MVLSSPPSAFFVAITVALLTTILTLYRIRDHAFTGLLLLLSDFGLAILLPFELIIATSLGVEESESLFLSSTMFYLAVFVSELLFPTVSQRLSHPISTVYLFFVVLLLSTSLESGLQLGLAIFAYDLSDNITIAAVVCLFISAITLPSNDMRTRLNDLVDLRRLEHARTSSRFGVTHVPEVPKSQETQSAGNVLQESTLSHCLKLLRKEEYESCVECCDMGVERFIESRFLLLYPNGLGAPLTIEEQLSKLSSKGLSLDEESITRLRRLRNTITISSRQATYRQAKWAVHVLRATVNPKSKLVNSPPVQ